MELLFIEAFDFANANGAATEDAILGDGDYDAYDFPILSGMIAVGMIIFLGAIFLYNNRTLQSTITKLGLAVVFAILGFAAFQFGAVEKMASAIDTTLSLSFGWASPALAILFSLLALRGISKDDKLVKSMDRLR